MPHQGHLRKWLTAALSAVALSFGPGAVTVAAAGPTPVPAARGVAAAPYLNLHQCLYYSGSAADHFTTFVPSRDGRFLAGTNVSGTADRAPTCGSGDGNFGLIPLLSGVKALDLRAGRYLNLHQCTYYSPSANNYFNTVVTSSDGRFAAGTNVSGTADRTPSCGSGDGNYALVPALSFAKALDLTSGTYVNLHQCLYYSAASTDHFTTVEGDSGPYRAGTNVSGTADTAPVCGTGTTAFAPIPLLSGVKALPLS
ncbi:hypothetical protein ABZ471_06125 [Streptomyces sp. NPDC005728]|uniref:hypothetical protein n=1 Tax=Streptomyces sp. NPDC005728 TaxID=3157054 RepID=UPI00340BC25A